MQFSTGYIYFQVFFSVVLIVEAVLEPEPQATWKVYRL